MSRDVDETSKHSHEVVIAGLPSMLPRLWRYGLVLARNPEIAEDLVQATCVRALENPSFKSSTRRSFSMKASMVLSHFASCRSLVGSPSGKRSAGQTSTQSIGRAEITAFCSSAQHRRRPWRN